MDRDNEQRTESMGRGLHSWQAVLQPRPIEAAPTPASEKVAIPRISNTPSKPRHRATRACEHCRQRKAKCDGAKPICTNCRQNDYTCVYLESKWTRDQKQIEDLTTKLREYELLLGNVASKVDAATAESIRSSLPKSDSPLQVPELSERETSDSLNETTSSQSEPPASGSGTFSDSSSGLSDSLRIRRLDQLAQKYSHESGSSSWLGSESADDTRDRLDTIDEGRSVSRTDLFSIGASVPPSTKMDLNWLIDHADDKVSKGPCAKQEQDISITLTAKNLPPEADVRDGAIAFFSNTSALFYVMSLEEFEGLVDQVYRGDNPVDIVTLCELCALASVGAQYLPDQQRQSAKRWLFATAEKHLDKCLELDRVRALRIIVCLAAYNILEHYNIAHSFINCGIRLARRLAIEFSGVPGQLDLVEKVYRTLIFMECWLATSLGLRPGLGDTENIFVANTRFFGLDLADQMAELAVQERAGVIAVIKTGILRDLYCPTPREEQIEFHMSKLEGWYLSLPQEMRLMALLSHDIPPNSLAKTRGLLFVHIIYLGAIILLHRRSVATVVLSELKNNTIGASTPAAFAIHFERMVVASQQLARMFILIDYEKNVYRRCWLCIYEIYSASTVLIFSLSYRILRHTDDGIQDDIERTEHLIHMLRCASSVDHVAKTLLDLVCPVFHEIHYLYTITRRFKAGTEPSWFSDACRGNMRKSADLLFENFGKDRRACLDTCEESVDTLPTWWG